MAKMLIYQRKAEQDVEQAIDYYTEKSKALGNKFYHELLKAYSHISDHPAIGSNRFAHELNIPNLKTWALTDFPYIIFYIEKAEYIHIYRVLHSSQQIPSWMFGS
ncbi:MAG: type II toxin-antitoxin system RelE/ParE family toxin [Gilliamella sp.]|uniref:type II toxin-antitoxin system RelE/ParE family toxin n=1 Tax=Gilliamella sp. TaxID=1891236 RepID=UPI0025D7BAF0|nr:type II toxin-antitoxin system RelE/ParE family toxin [Gilliamella sp.]MCO6545511.1 type II toxin-antitoxin system RelE/ParE family toxin [Gilliamella sp.]MCO6548267.1 type II toxin-antitoxin system RelE/ParE family toxin [Gilliamella sp.]